MKWLIGVAFLLITLVSCVLEMREIKRRETAEKLFEEACELLKQNRNDEALERLQFIRWGLVCPKWFNTFLDTNKIVTRERYMKKLQDSKLLSEEELLHGMNRLEKVARLIGKTNW